MIADCSVPGFKFYANKIPSDADTRLVRGGNRGRQAVTACAKDVLCKSVSSDGTLWSSSDATKLKDYKHGDTCSGTYFIDTGACCKLCVRNASMAAATW